MIAADHLAFVGAIVVRSEPAFNETAPLPMPDAEFRGIQSNTWAKSGRCPVDSNYAATPNAEVGAGTQTRSCVRAVAQLIGISERASKRAIAARPLQASNAHAFAPSASPNRHMACISIYRRMGTMCRAALAPGGEQP